MYKIFPHFHAEIVVGLEKTFYNTTEGETVDIQVCIALMNGTIRGDTAEIIFLISYHDAPMSTATTSKSTTTLPSSHFLPFNPFFVQTMSLHYYSTMQQPTIILLLKLY